MSYRLRLDEPVPETVRAVALERLDRAVRRLRDDHGEDPVEAVHGARKDLKKARALVRLVRPGLPRSVYRAANDELRDIGRTMSAGRDADVMVETVDALAERFAGALPKAQFAELRRRLAARAEQRRGAVDADELVSALEAARERATGWPLGDGDDDVLVAGAARIYRRGRKRFAAAERDPSPERVHEWRKRAKDLWYHQRLLRDVWPGPMKAFVDESDRLGDLLGDDHDLATLAGVLTEVDPVNADQFLELITTRRQELTTEAFDLGRRVYAEKPKAFARRLATYLAAARAATRPDRAALAP